MTIRFGTDGWRAIIAEEFTFGNVRRLTAAIERAMSGGRTGGAPVVVGHDTRFLSDRFAGAVAETLLGAGRPVVLSEGPCPTPAASCQTVACSAPFAIVITASHNPAAFNGVKIKDASGSSADTDVTSACERSIRDHEYPPRMDLAEGRARGLLIEKSFEPAHVERLSKMVDLPALRAAGFSVVADPMYGAAGRLLERILAGGRTTVDTIRSERDPLFGGSHPEPIEDHLTILRDKVRSCAASAGFATDGDGDRIGAFDEKGQFVSPLRIAPLLALHLIRRGRRGPLGKTFANTLLLDRIAKQHGLPFTTFPVGFKHIAKAMRDGRMLLGGEESGGIGIEGYIPERDGVLVSLMLLQAMADQGKPLGQMVEEMGQAYGEYHYRRRDLACPSDVGGALVRRLHEKPPSTIGGLRITGIDALDGLKLLFGEDGWVLFRASGTEPVLRVYSEAPNPDALDAIMNEALSLVVEQLDKSPH